MNKKMTALILFLPLICLSVWIGGLQIQRDNGMDVKTVITGYDPRDLLSGHYLQYQIDWEKTDCRQFADNTCPQQDFCKDARWGKQCRFYVPEEYAAKLDNLFRNGNFVFEVVYSYHKGRPAMAKQLLINGAEWLEFIKQKAD